MLVGQAQQRHRYTDVIIKVARRIKRVTALAKDRRRHLFNGGFTRRARQRHDASRYLLANPCRQLAKRQARIFHHNLRQIDIELTTDQQRARAVIFSLLRKIVGVKTLALQRHKQAARRHLTGVGGHSFNGQILTMQHPLQYRSGLA